ncbi:MAG: ParA family protein [Aeromonas sp.]
MTKSTMIAVAHNKGGVGKTTTITQLAGAMSPSLIIDLDAHQGISIINRQREPEQQWNVVVPRDDTHLRRLLDAEHDGMVLIDCGGFDSTRTRAAIACADLLICPSNDDLSEQIGLVKMHDVVKEISQAVGRHISAKVLMTRTNPARRNYQAISEQLAQQPHMTLMRSRLSRRADYPNAMMEGRGVTERASTRHSEAGKEVAELITEIAELLN